MRRSPTAYPLWAGVFTVCLVLWVSLGETPYLILGILTGLAFADCVAEELGAGEDR